MSTMDRGDNRAAVGVMTQTRSLEGRSLGMCPSLRLPEVSRLRLLEPGTSFVIAWGEQKRPASSKALCSWRRATAPLR